MSSNTFQLAGTAGGAGNGWGAATGVGTMTLGNAVNFVWEAFANYPKLVRVTLSGTYTIAASGAGALTLTYTIPLTSLPTWARPAAPTSPATINTSVGGASGFPTSIAVAWYSVNVTNNGTSMIISVSGQASALVAAISQNAACVLTYIGQ